jgi:hypothetical protein
MIKHHKEFVKALAACCAGIDDHLAAQPKGDTVEYWLRKPVDLEKLDRLVQETRFIQPVGRTESKDHWILEVMDGQVNRPDTPFRVEEGFAGSWVYITEEEEE